MPVALSIWRYCGVMQVGEAKLCINGFEKSADFFDDFFKKNVQAQKQNVCQSGLI